MTDSSQSPEIQKIDIKKVFHDKSPSIARLLPGFVYAYLKKILHLDFINGLLERHGQKSGLEFIEGAIEEFDNTMEIVGAENIPKEGRFMFVSNHPLGGFDGIMLIHIIRQRFPSVVFLVNDILMNMRILNEFLIPINKEGGQSRESVRLIEEAYQSDAQIISFPSGYVSRKIKGKIQDLPWHKSFHLGGISTLRGYGYKAFPNGSQQPGGNRMVLAQIEYRIGEANIPDELGLGLFDMFNFIVFADAGWAWNAGPDDNLFEGFKSLKIGSLKTDVGIALANRSGSVRFEIARRTDRGKKPFTFYFRINRPF